MYLYASPFDESACSAIFSISSVLFTPPSLLSLDGSSVG
jgi:hypothetical protein